MEVLTGEIEQRPPAYSAVQVGGERLYKAARRGEAVEAPARSVRVDRFELTAIRCPRLRLHRGLLERYVRPFAVADVGSRLGPGAHLTRLVRTRIGHFSLDHATGPDDVGEPLALEVAVAHLPRFELSEEETEAARHGRVLGPPEGPGFHAAVDPAGHLVGIYRDCGTKSCPEVVIPG